MIRTIRSAKIAFAAALALLAWAGCSDENPLGGQDNTPPAVSVVQPADAALVQTSRPAFLVRLSDSGSGVFVATLEVLIDGQNVSQPFINGYNGDQGESRVPGLIELADGLHTMRVRVADNAGNATTQTIMFTTLNNGGGPPPGGQN
jgi:hypothetical protein